MHILFVHQNYPGQFGHVADVLAGRGVTCTFVSENVPEGTAGPVGRVAYKLEGGASERTHPASRTFENAVWHAAAVYEALRAAPQLRPDLVVGHSGFGSTLFLRELYDCPIVNYFEYFYHVHNSDVDFRPDFPCDASDRNRVRAKNAMILLDLENADLGYCPTNWQHSRFPPYYREKLRVAFDGIDTRLWRPLPRKPGRLGRWELTEGLKVVTYVARGMESMRGFDVFMRMARLLCKRRNDVIFVVVGKDRVCYGNDARFTGGRTFLEWVLSRDDYDLSRFVFPGLVPSPTLAQLFANSDLHVYLTVPFILSWSLLNALACGATVLASDTAPVREVIEPGVNGLLADFFDVEGLADQAERVLDAPDAFRHLGRAGVETVRRSYSLDACLPRQLAIFDEALGLRPRAGGTQRLLDA
jgi:glycosyltransferase involved in cell wall biosynthesis